LIADGKVRELKRKAGMIRKMSLIMMQKRGAGHPGGSFSIADILSVLYFHHMNIERIDDPERDRLILSKGHACFALYAVLSLKGFLGDDMLSMDVSDIRLQGHPDMNKTPGIEMSSGSLGQGLSVGLGLSLGLKLKNNPGRVYIIMGDGELNEGQVWEAAMAAAHYKADNLTAVIDSNGLQIMGSCADVMDTGPLKPKWEAFGWNAIEIDGHDMSEIDRALEKAKDTKGKPTVIIARTIKGKGVSFMENEVKWHQTSEEIRRFFMVRPAGKRKIYVEGIK